MEDRVTPSLYLEFIHGPLEPYVATRVPEVLAVDGAERATWWQAGGTWMLGEQRMTIDNHLTPASQICLYEVGEAFRPPAFAAPTAWIHWRRYPRPNQGLLSWRPTIGLLLVLVDATSPEYAQEVRDFLDFVHIPRVVSAASGISLCTVYENTAGERPRYLHVYEITDSDPTETMREVIARLPEMLGGEGSTEYRHFLSHPHDVWEANTFSLVGEAPERAPYVRPHFTGDT